MDKKIRIAIVDDHQIVIDGLSALLKEEKSLEIVFTSTSGFEVLDKLNNTEIDILLTDVMMPEMNGRELAGKVKHVFPHIRIIALSMNDQGTIIDDMISHADIAGYLLKHTGKSELINAIHHVFSGKQYFPDFILEQIEKHCQIKKNIDVVNLTLRETEIIKLLENDLSNKQISEQLNISVRTIETHRKNILKKTGTNNVLSLVKWAYEHNVIAK